MDILFKIQFLLGIVICNNLHWILAKLAASECGTKFKCLKYPSSCTSHKDCNYLIMYKQHAGNETMDITMSAKLSGIKWLALGFSNKGQMDGGKGEVCLTPGLGMKSFLNNGYSPTFSSSLATLVESYVLEGALICRFQRNINANGYQVDLYKPWYIIYAAGDNTINNNPTRHQERNNLGQHTLAEKIITSTPSLSASISKSDLVPVGSTKSGFTNSIAPNRSQTIPMLMSTSVSNMTTNMTHHFDDGNGTRTLKISYILYLVWFFAIISLIGG